MSEVASWRLLEAVPGAYLGGETYTVKALDLGRDAVAIGGRTQGRVYWTGDGWRFEVDPRAGYPLESLLHEVGHVVLGHTARVAEGPPAPLGAADRAWVRSQASEVREREADTWAEREVRRWEAAWFRSEVVRDVSG